MKNSGIGNHLIYNFGKDQEEVVNEIMDKLDLNVNN